MKATSDWKLKDWLEAGAYTAVMLAIVIGLAVFVNKTRANAIEENRQLIARAWTNEGDILSTETRFVDLTLQNFNGDVLGTLRSPQLDDTLDVHANIGWFSSELTITQLQGRSIIPVATVTVRMAGNNNRLLWQASSDQFPEYLPEETTLWSF